MQTETISPNSITPGYLDALKQANLLNRNDAANIARLTKQLAIRQGKGYGAEHVRNFLYRQYITTPQMIETITRYYEEKKLRKELAAHRQKEFISKLKNDAL